MKRKIRMTLDVEIEDLPKAERRQAALDADCREGELPRVEDISPSELAELIAGSLPINEEMFGGSEMYCKITKARGFNAGDAP